ncbi:MAG TPA: hypothetical protein VFY48_00375 [Solirubrobacterales bacterium]|nr:hypothetical protein [Solirubrobacterales bacterium]
MPDLGQPSSYLAVRKDVPVYTSDGTEIGRVEKVLSAPNIDMFDGIVVDTKTGPGGHRFVDAPEVDGIYENGVTLKIDAAAAAQLPKPGPNPGTIQASAADFAGAKRGTLGRIWDRLSGKG